MTDILYYLAFSFILFMIGIYCLATKRNIVRLILGIEIMVNAAHMSFIALATTIPNVVDPFAQSVVIVSIGLAASVSAVAITIVVYAYRHYGTLDARALKRLRE